MNDYDCHDNSDYTLEDCAIAYQWLQSDECAQYFHDPFRKGPEVLMPVLLLQAMRHHGYLVGTDSHIHCNPDVLANPEITPADPEKGDPPDWLSFDSLDNVLMDRVEGNVHAYMREVAEWEKRVGRDPISVETRRDVLKEYADYAVDKAIDRWLGVDDDDQPY